jgi:hypothetical protein
MKNPHVPTTENSIKFDDLYHQVLTLSSSSDIAGKLDVHPRLGEIVRMFVRDMPTSMYGKAILNHWRDLEEEGLL